MALCLTPEEIGEVTGKERPSAQIRVLIATGIAHRVRPDGSILVWRAHVEHLLNPGHSRKVTPKEPNWNALTPERV